MMAKAGWHHKVLLVVTQSKRKVEVFIADLWLVLNLKSATDFREDLFSTQLSVINLAVDGHRRI